MFCTNCGAQIADDAVFCPSCGSSTNQSSAPQSDTQYVSASYVAPSAATVPAQGMKWYKFVIYFQLFFSAFIGLITGIITLTGYTYTIASGGYITASTVYAWYPALHAIDIIMGLATIALAVMAIYVRQHLAKFKTGAPKKYLIFLAVSLIVDLVYVIAASLAYGMFAGSSSTIVSMITSVILIIVNKIYFDKRAHLFVN